MRSDSTGKNPSASHEGSPPSPRSNTPEITTPPSRSVSTCRRRRREAPATSTRTDTAPESRSTSIALTCSGSVITPAKNKLPATSSRTSQGEHVVSHCRAPFTNTVNSASWMTESSRFEKRASSYRTIGICVHAETLDSVSTRANERLRIMEHLFSTDRIRNSERAATRKGRRPEREGRRDQAFTLLGRYQTEGFAPSSGSSWKPAADSACFFSVSKSPNTRAPAGHAATHA